MAEQAQLRQVPPTALLNGRVAFACVGDVGIMVLTVDHWTDQDVITLLNESSRLGGNVTATGNISHFFGDVFGATHRKLIVDWLASRGLPPSPRNATLTDSKMMRAALTAYSWLTKTENKAFEPYDRDALCTWITQGLRANPADVKAALEKCYAVVNRPLPQK